MPQAAACRHGGVWQRNLTEYIRFVLVLMIIVARLVRRETGRVAGMRAVHLAPA